MSGCDNPNCSCGSSCSCGSGCKCGRTGLEFSESTTTTTTKILIAGVAPLQMYCEESEMNFGEVSPSLARSNSSCDSFGFHI